MFRLLLLLIIVIPALEIWVLITAGKLIGTIPTVLLIILTGIVGAWLAKQQGLFALKVPSKNEQWTNARRSNY